MKAVKVFKQLTGNSIKTSQLEEIVALANGKGVEEVVQMIAGSDKSSRQFVFMAALYSLARNKFDG
jgi:ethanolamine ammonia-lyase large subunit